jgi:hypothetical protein
VARALVVVPVNSGDEPPPFPKLCRTPVHELFGALDCRLVACALNIVHVGKMTVTPNDINPIRQHERQPPFALRNDGENLAPGWGFVYGEPALW